MTHLLRCCAQINPQRIKDTPAVNLCSRLVSASYICKRLTESLFSRAVFPCSSNICESKILLLKILNVSERPRMDGVPIRNEFRRKTKFAGNECIGVHSLPCLRFIFVCALYLFALFVSKIFRKRVEKTGFSIKRKYPYTAKKLPQRYQARCLFFLIL